MTSSTDANGRTTTFSYDPATRLNGKTLPTGASEAIVYDDVDVAMKITDTTSLNAGNAGAPAQLATQTVTTQNGLGLPATVASLADGSVWNVVAIQYDAMGRVANTSLPYRSSSQQPAWTSFTYDALGRLTKRQTADGSQYLSFYDETTRPSSASGSPGETVHSQDPWGRERWSRLDALDNLAEVVEPNPSGSGLVSDPGNMVTNYTFDALGRLTQVSQGEQTRQFEYDPLGNLIAEYLPEKSRSLDDQGHHVASGAKWSDVFTYDDRSNLATHVDARGVKTTYVNGNLDLLGSITYDASGAWDTVNPVTPTPGASFQYMASGDLRRPHLIYGAPGANPALCGQEFDYYDSGYQEGWLSSVSTSCRPNQALAVGYNYDTLGRITGRTYPVEYGTPGLARRVVSEKPGIGNVVDEVDVDNAPMAAQITYAPSGPVASLVMGEGTPQSTSGSFWYDPGTGRLTAQTVTRGSTELLDFSYGYLKSGASGTTGQLTTFIDKLNNTRQRAYQYDALGRLTTVADSPYWGTSYGYDRYGNRETVTVTGKAADGSAIPPDGLPHLEYNPATNHISTTGFLYDAAGNVTRAQRADGSWLRYRYDAAGRLASVLSDAGAVLESYSYSADGHRLTTDNPGASGRSTYFAWDSDLKIGEYRPLTTGGDLIWSSSSVYLGSRLLATLEPNGSANLVRYRNPDRVGNVRLITNSVNANSSMQVTLPFGTLLPGESSSEISPIFTSYDRSSATGQDYAVNRFYDPQTRFSQPDPAEMAAVSQLNPRTLNQYAYVGDDPINAADRLGSNFMPDPSNPASLIKITSAAVAAYNAGGVPYVLSQIRSVVAAAMLQSQVAAAPAADVAAGLATSDIAAGTAATGTTIVIANPVGIAVTLVAGVAVIQVGTLSYMGSTKSDIQKVLSSGRFPGSYANSKVFSDRTRNEANTGAGMIDYNNPIQSPVPDSPAAPARQPTAILYDMDGNVISVSHGVLPYNPAYDEPEPSSGDAGGGSADSQSEEED